MSSSEVAVILGCDVQCFRNQARTDPEKLGFPVTIIGRRVRIPKASFLDYCGLTASQFEARIAAAWEREEKRCKQHNA